MDRSTRLIYVAYRCEVVGNRQMLSIGGRDPLDDGQGILSPDPIKHGLQIFDLTEMKWSDRYDSNAAPYTTPQVVKDWYQKKSVQRQHEGQMSELK